MYSGSHCPYILVQQVPRDAVKFHDDPLAGNFANEELKNWFNGILMARSAEEYCQTYGVCRVHQLSGKASAIAVGRRP
jgi:hypothetical protein